MYREKGHFQQADRKIMQKRAKKRKKFAPQNVVKGTIALKNKGHVLFIFHGGGVKTFVLCCSVPLTPAPRKRAVSSSLPKQRSQTASEKKEK